MFVVLLVRSGEPPCFSFVFPPSGGQIFPEERAALCCCIWVLAVYSMFDLRRQINGVSLDGCTKIAMYSVGWLCCVPPGLTADGAFATSGLM